MLEVKSLGVQLGRVTFCFDLTLDRGEQLAVLGPSGAGKSTLLNLIGGFLSVEHGTLLFEGNNITHTDPALRPVTTLFQDHNLFAHLSVADNIGLGLKPSLNLSERERLLVSSTLIQVGLDNYEDRSASKLSGGQAQRVALARCLVRKKPILLLDEPFSALDERTRGNMLLLTKTVVMQNNISTIFITHNEDDANQFATRKLRINNGKVVD